MLKNPTGNFKKLPDLAYLPPIINMPKWIRQLTAAIVYSATLDYDATIDWKKIKVESPEWIFTKGPGTVETTEAISHFTRMGERKSILLLNLNWEDGWSAHPRPYPKSIYKFNIHLSSDVIMVRHLFYERYNWFAWVPESSQIIEKIRNKIPLYHS
jgi:hypothetical protein